LLKKDPAKADALKRLSIEYEDRIRQLEATEGDHSNRRLRLFSAEYERLSREGLKQERATILELRTKKSSTTRCSAAFNRTSISPKRAFDEWWSETSSRPDPAQRW